MSERSAHPAVLWTLGVVVLRLCLSGDDAALHRIDELYNGAAALELAAGRGDGLAAAAWDPYSGGSLAVIQMLRVVFALLGPSYLSLKLLALSFTALTTFLWLRIARSLFGATTAHFAGALFLFSPLAYQQLGVMAWGNHPESALPAAAAFLALLKARGATSPRSAAAWAATSGCCATLAPFFSWMGAISIAAWFGVVVTSERGARVRARLALAAGAAIGALPFLWFVAARGGEGVGVLDVAVRPQFGAAPFKLWRLLTEHLPDYLGTGLWGGIATALVVCAFVQFLFGPRRPLASILVVVLVPCAFALAFAVTGFHLGSPVHGVIAFRYLAPVTPHLLIAIAVMLARLPRIPALAAITATAAMLGAPALARAVFVSRHDGLTVLTYPGYSYSAYGWHLLDSCRRDLPCIEARVEHIEPKSARNAARHGVAIGVSIDDRVALWSTNAEQRPARILAFLARAEIAPTLAPDLVERAALVWSSRPGLVVTAGERARLLTSLGRRATTTPFVAAAFALSAADAATLAETTSLEPESRDAALYGFGQALARRDRPCPVSLTPQDAAACARGAGFATTWQALTGGGFRALVWSEDARAGSDHALWFFEPDAFTRRRDLARALAATGSAPTTP